MEPILSFCPDKARARRALKGNVWFFLSICVLPLAIHLNYVFLTRVLLTGDLRYCPTEYPTFKTTWREQRPVLQI